MAKQILSFARVSELLSYDVATGGLSWKIRRGRQAKGRPAGTVNHSDGYVYVQIDRRLYGAHRIAWLLAFGQWPPQEIDHRNGVKTDNRIANLRLAAPFQNRQNMMRFRNNTSGHTGVSWSKQNKKWMVKVRRRGIDYRFGGYDDKNVAIAVQRAAKARLHDFQPVLREDVASTTQL